VAQPLGPGGELFFVLRGPPVAHASLRVKLPPLVIKTVQQLVSDHRSHGTVVDGVINGEIKEGRLENAGRKDNLILQGGKKDWVL